LLRSRLVVLESVTLQTIDSSSLIDHTALSRAAVSVVERLCDNDYSAFIVGGAVRDLLLGKRPKDFDVATDATPEQVVALFRGSRIIGRRFQIVHVRMGREIIEVTTFRGHHEDGVPKTAVKSQKGLLLRDNVYGTLDQDAARRDLTINALYLDPVNQLILDDLQGLEDIRRRVIRIIGDPATRYSEDPVRMLRVVRFAAKLGFSIEQTSVAAISERRHLLADIPAARLFDETLKLFMAGFAAPTIEHLANHKLLEPLFPEALPAMDDASSRALILKAMGNTDARIARGKPVTPAFLLGALLWPAVAAKGHAIASSGAHDGSPINAAGQEVLAITLQRVAIPKRFSIPMREIWELQPRLEKCSSKRVKSVLAQRRFRAAFDLLLLRAESSDQLKSAVVFWEEQQQLFPEVVGSLPATEIPQRKRPRRRKRNQ
jgi:poly(A) polymerase